MTKRGIAAEMRKHTDPAAAMVLAEYGQTLDFSEPTIGAVEAILDGFGKEDDLSDSLAANVSLLFGAGGEWVAKALEKGFRFVPSGVEGLPSVTEAAVFPDRLELLCEGQWVVIRFLDVARCRP